VIELGKEAAAGSLNDTISLLFAEPPKGNQQMRLIANNQVYAA